MSPERDVVEQEVFSVDLLGLVNQVKSGDEKSFDLLVGHLKPMVYRFCVSRLPLAAENLTWDTLGTVFEKLDDFSNSGRGTFNQNFHAWVFAIAKIEIRKEWKNIKTWTTPLTGREGTALQDSVILEDELDKDTLADRLRVVVSQVVSPRQHEVVALNMQGKTMDEIAELMGITETTVGKHLRLALLQVEERFILPVGYRRVSSFGERFTNAARAGSLDAVRFLGHWYVTQRMVEDYISRRQRGLNKPYSRRVNSQQEFDAEIAKLRALDLTNAEIAHRLHTSLNTISQSIKRLVRSGVITRRISTTEERNVFREKVKALRVRGKTNRDIQKELGERHPNRVRVFTSELIQAGEIDSQASSSDTKDRMMQLLDKHTKEQPGQKVNLSGLARALGITRERARQLYDKIASSHPVPEKGVRNEVVRLYGRG